MIYSLYAQSGQVLFQRDERSSKRRQYIYLGGSMVAESDMPLVGSTATVTYQHTDALGTPVAITNSSKTVIERREYEPYGYQTTPTLQDGPNYTGHVADAATGLIYMQQRYYDPTIGRFDSTDAVTAYSEPVASFNRYWYASNNPCRFTDPDGRHVYDPYLLSGGAGNAAELGSQPASGGEAQRRKWQYSYPLTQSDPEWTRDERLREETEKSWSESNPFAPNVARGHSGSEKHEQGGWVVKYRSGKIGLVKVARGSRDSINIGRPPSCACIPIGWFHTHPNEILEGYSQHAGPEDYETSQYYRVPGLIRNHSGYELIPVYP